MAAQEAAMPGVRTTATTPESSAGAVTTRRTLLGAGLGALGALIANALGRAEPARANDGDAVFAGSAVTSFRTTSIASLGADPTFAATSQTGTGIRGQSTDAKGVLGTSESGNGVEGRSNTAKGVYGYSNGGPGVYGYSGSGDGVWGYAGGPGGQGIRGQANDLTATGVRGEHLITETVGILGAPNFGVAGGAGATTDSVGVLASASPPATALAVVGTARFSQSGKALVAPRTRSVDVIVPGGVRATSLVLATLMLDRPGAYIQSAVPNPATGRVRINLNKVASSRFSTPIAWFLIN
jgi:hypothetical protein